MPWPRLQLQVVFVILLVLLSFGLVLYVSRRNIIEDVLAPVPVHVNYEHKKKAFPSSFPDKHPSPPPSDDINVDQQYLKEIQVGENEYYKPVNVYGSPIDQEKFTIIIQTFNRTDLLMRVLNHYSGLQGVDRILIVWNTLGEVPPYQWWEELGPHPTEVIFLEQTVNNVRNRLQRFSEIRTEGV